MAQQDIRRERYQYFRSLGFSSGESRSLRDNSAARGTLRIDTEVRSIRSRPLTPESSARLAKLSNPRPVPATTPARKRESTGETQSRRLANFRRWSQRNVGFPSDVLTRIQDINIEAGFDINSGHGYRVFYHRYVNGESPDDAEKRAERRDT